MISAINVIPGFEEDEQVGPQNRISGVKEKQRAWFITQRSHELKSELGIKLSETQWLKMVFSVKHWQQWLWLNTYYSGDCSKYSVHLSKPSYRQRIREIRTFFNFMTQPRGFFFCGQSFWILSSLDLVAIGSLLTHNDPFSYWIIYNCPFQFLIVT